MNPVVGQTYTSVAGIKSTVTSVTKKRVVVKNESGLKWSMPFFIFDATYGKGDN